MAALEVQSVRQPQARGTTMDIPPGTPRPTPPGCRGSAHDVPRKHSVNQAPKLSLLRHRQSYEPSSPPRITAPCPAGNSRLLRSTGDGGRPAVLRAAPVLRRRTLAAPANGIRV